MAPRVDPVRKTVKDTLDDVLAGHAEASHAGPASALKYLERVISGQANLPMAVRTVVHDRMADAQAQLQQWTACVESVNRWWLDPASAPFKPGHCVVVARVASLPGRDVSSVQGTDMRPSPHDSRLVVIRLLIPSVRGLRPHMGAAPGS